MNKQTSLSRTIAIYAGMTVAGIAVVIAGKFVSPGYEQTLMVGLGSAVFGAGLAFFLIRMSARDNK
jgi:hypothetical protein